MDIRDFLLGLLTGAVAGILFSPKSGKETREEMRRYYFEMKDQILENLPQIKDITKETYENVVNTVVAGYEEAKKITTKEAAEIREELKAGYDRIKKVTSKTPEPPQHM
ncbi:MAG: YtxH domain-containing protein [Candidatus Aminicenantes bacterium]